MDNERPHIPADLPAAWRERAEWLREYGDPNSARLWLSAARELENGLQAYSDEPFSLVEAAKVIKASCQATDGSKGISR